MKFNFYNVIVLVLAFWTLFTIFIFSSLRGRASDLELAISEIRSSDITKPIEQIQNMLISISSKQDESIKLVPDHSHNFEIPNNNNKKDDNYSPVRTTGKKRKIPVVIFTYQRHGYLKRCLEKVFERLPVDSSTEFPIYVSQDGGNENVKNVIKEFKNKLAGSFQKEHTARFENPMMGPQSYYYISQHYEFGIRSVFNENPDFESVIILEEDIEVANDFFEYMESMEDLTKRDTSLLCASAFNDNGLPEHVDDPLALYRSDFFPGLGWLLPKRIWEEFDAKGWPIGFWDDWIRLPQNRKGRACIRPEISRTFTFGERGGASKGQFSDFLNRIQLDHIPVNWKKIDTSYLEKKNYDEWLDTFVESLEAISIQELGKFDHQKKNLKITYNSQESFISLARKVNIMQDEKCNVPRGAYKGIVTIKYKGNNIFLTPSREDLLYSNSKF